MKSIRNILIGLGIIGIPLFIFKIIQPYLNLALISTIIFYGFTGLVSIFFLYKVGDITYFMFNKQEETK